MLTKINKLNCLPRTIIPQTRLTTIADLLYWAGNAVRSKSGLRFLSSNIIGRQNI
jgi:hypothetical protein